MTGHPLKLTDRKRRPPLQATYTVSQLERLSGISRFALHRMLRRHGVHVIRDGRTLLVPLTSLRELLPEVWPSILLVWAIEGNVADVRKALRE